jgi:GNAT superfamily N-acetyltransferase
MQERVDKKLRDEERDEEIKKIFKTDEKIYLSSIQENYILDDKYIKTTFKVKKIDSEDPLYPEVLYKVNFYIYEKNKDTNPFINTFNTQQDLTVEKEDPIGSLETSFEWITDEKNPRYLDLLDYKFVYKCPLIYCYISSLFVSKWYRGRGYGTILMEQLEKCLIETSKKFNVTTLYIAVTDVSKYSETSESIYVKQGFEYRYKSSKSSLKKMIEFENGERIIDWRVTESEMKMINEGLELLKERNGIGKREKRKYSKSCQTE